MEDKRFASVPTERQKQDDLRTTDLGAPEDAVYARPAGLQARKGRKLVQRNMYERDKGSRR